jgi:hypothetical protein
MESKQGVRVGGVFEFTCFGPDGKIKWKETAKNLVTNEGLDHILDILFKSGTQVDPWYVGLTDGTPSPAAGDQLTGTHAGWTEVTAYTEGARQAFVEGAISSQSLDNSASKASFAINANSTTIGGGFLASSATTGANGDLLCVAAFTGGDKSADSGDTLEVQYTFSAADDGA